MIYAFLYIALWAIFFIYWIACSFGNKKSLYRGRPFVRMGIFILAVAGVGLLYNMAGWPTVQLVPRGDLTDTVGVLLCAAGIGFAIWARRTLGTNWSANPTIKEGHELITDGPYRIVRHPIYTGLLLAVFGSELADGRLSAFIVFLICTTGIIVKLTIEERLMMRQFPNEYAAYKKRAKALIPFVL